MGGGWGEEREMGVGIVRGEEGGERGGEGRGGGKGVATAQMTVLYMPTPALHWTYANKTLSVRAEGLTLKKASSPSNSTRSADKDKDCDATELLTGDIRRSLYITHAHTHARTHARTHTHHTLTCTPTHSDPDTLTPTEHTHTHSPMTRDTNAKGYCEENMVKNHGAAMR